MCKGPGDYDWATVPPPQQQTHRVGEGEVDGVVQALRMGVAQKGGADGREKLHPGPMDRALMDAAQPDLILGVQVQGSVGHQFLHALAGEDARQGTAWGTQRPVTFGRPPPTASEAASAGPPGQDFKGYILWGLGDAQDFCTW